MVWVATFAGMRSSRSSLFLWTSVVVFSMLLHINGQCFATAAPSTHGAGVVPGVASAVPWMRDVVAELEGERFHATPQLSSVSSAATPDDILRGGGSVSVWNSERCRAHYLRRLASLDSGGNANNVDARSNRRVSGDSDSWLTRVDGDGVLSHAREVKDGGVLVTIEDVVNCVPDDAQVPRLPGLPITKKEKENSYLCGFEVSDEDLKDRMSPDRSHWPCHVLPLAKAPVTPLSVRRCTDIVISKEFRFIYIDNVKAGSSTVRAMLQNVFHYSARSAARLKPRKPQEFFIRSDNHILSCYLTATSSLSNGELTKNHATGLHEFNPDDYFVFSFVRDPRSRFFSGFGQADWQICRETPGTESGNFRALTQFRRGKTDAEVYSARVARMLTMIESGVNPNEHVQSQAYRLGATDSNGVQLDIDFIGRLETLSADLNHVIAIICDRASSLGIAHLPKQCSAPNNAPHRNSSKRKEEETPARNDTSLTRRICDLFSQDYECFGYPLPEECTSTG